MTAAPAKLNPLAVVARVAREATAADRDDRAAYRRWVLRLAAGETGPDDEATMLGFVKRLGITAPEVRGDVEAVQQLETWATEEAERSATYDAAPTVTDLRGQIAALHDTMAEARKALAQIEVQLDAKRTVAARRDRLVAMARQKRAATKRVFAAHWLDAGDPPARPTIGRGRLNMFTGPERVQ
jgi:hypothetical protein